MIDVQGIILDTVDKYWEYKWYVLGGICLITLYIILNHYGIEIPYL